MGAIKRTLGGLAFAKAVNDVLRSGASVKLNKNPFLYRLFYIAINYVIFEDKSSFAPSIFTKQYSITLRSLRRRITAAKKNIFSRDFSPRYLDKTQYLQSFTSKSIFPFRKALSYIFLSSSVSNTQLSSVAFNNFLSTSRDHAASRLSAVYAAEIISWCINNIYCPPKDFRKLKMRSVYANNISIFKRSPVLLSLLAAPIGLSRRR